MRRIIRIIARMALILLLVLAGASWILLRVPHAGRLPASFPHITRQPAAWRAPTKRLGVVPHHTDDANAFQVDLRGADVTGLDFSESKSDLNWAVFDRSTLWPPREKLPANFDPQTVFEVGKNPGLGLRSLHARGITGRGVGVAVIDQPLLVGHREYADRLRLYEDVGFSLAAQRIVDYRYATMHGCATASIAVGNTVGVAPEADLYFIATTPLTFPYVTRGSITFKHYAASVRRILQINQTLPQAQRIRAISLSIGWRDKVDGFDQITAAINDAKAQNILVTSSSLESTHHFKFHGLGRDPSLNPDDFSHYRPGMFWERSFDPADQWMVDRLMVPMDHRTLTAPGAADDYAHYGAGGWSWCTPYLAGVYALACQVEDHARSLLVHCDAHRQSHRGDGGRSHNALGSDPRSGRADRCAAPAVAVSAYFSQNSRKNRPKARPVLN